VPAGESEGYWLAGAGEADPLDGDGTITVNSLRLGNRGSTMDEITPEEKMLDELRVEVEELRASRARVVAAADGQRRRIERLLHDGPVQNLIALAVNVQLASRQVDSDPAALKQLLDEMRRNVQEALDDVRHLSWRVYPSLLLDRGLGDALRAAASEAGIPTRVESEGLDRCSPEVEATIYFCCVELLEHAADGGRHAIVRVRSEPEAVCVEVIVAGASFEDWATLDLTPISDRLGAFGGRLTVAQGSEPEGGVCISGAMPVVP
jgi:signal transduction histidine kinase